MLGGYGRYPDDLEYLVASLGIPGLSFCVLADPLSTFCHLVGRALI